MAKAKDEALIFFAKLSGVACLTALLSAPINSFALSKELFTKPRYQWGNFEAVPLTRGWFHGLMAIAHGVRAFSIRSPYHAFFVAQYGVSFLLHNTHCR